MRTEKETGSYENNPGTVNLNLVNTHTYTHKKKAKMKDDDDARDTLEIGKRRLCPMCLNLFIQPVLEKLTATIVYLNSS